MTTDAMIIALVATGKFTLPSRLNRGSVRCMIENKNEPVWCVGGSDVPDHTAHDLCAMHFAREWKPTNEDVNGRNQSRFEWVMGHGDAHNAIRILYVAVTGRQP